MTAVMPPWAGCHQVASGFGEVLNELVVHVFSLLHVPGTAAGCAGPLHCRPCAGESASLGGMRRRVAMLVTRRAAVSCIACNVFHCFRPSDSRDHQD